MLCSTHAVRSGAREPMGASRRGLTALPLHGTSAGGARQTSGRAAAPSPMHRLSSRNSGPRLLFQTVEATLPSSGAPGRGEHRAGPSREPGTGQALSQQRPGRSVRLAFLAAGVSTQLVLSVVRGTPPSPSARLCLGGVAGRLSLTWDFVVRGLDCGRPQLWP